MVRGGRGLGLRRGVVVEAGGWCGCWWFGFGRPVGCCSGRSVRDGTALGTSDLKALALGGAVLLYIVRTTRVLPAELDYQHLM